MRVLLMSLIVTAAIALGCSTRANTKSEQAAQPLSAPTSVNTVQVVSRQLRTTVTLPSQLIPYETVDVFPKVTGFVETITVDRGSRVRRGQLLVRLRAPELGSQSSQATASMRTAQSQLLAAKARLSSDNGSYLHMLNASKTPGVIAENDLAVAEQTVEADKGNVRAAEQNVAAAREALSAASQTEAYLTITAPFDGVVTTRNLHPGALIGPASGQAGSSPILQIVNDRRLRLIVPVPEAQVGDLRAGEQVSFTVPAYPGQTFTAPMRRISRQVDERSRTMPVELDVNNAHGKLSPGSYATVAWPVRRSYPTLFVPTTAVTSDQQHTFVIRVRDNKAEWVTVQSGQSVDNAIEVFGDLKPGDQVVKAATDAVRPGESVKAQPSR